MTIRQPKSAIRPGLPALRLAAGTLDDYRALARHHYRAGRPATVTRILAMYDDAPTVADRYGNRDAVARPVAVLVESMPPLSCASRDAALPGRYEDVATCRRAALLNAEVRTISRVIVEPTWRGVGLAVRLVRAALNSAETVYTEALAAMGAVNPFFERAGMTAYRRPPHPHDARLLDAMQSVGVDVYSCGNPADTFAALADDRRAFIERELRRWHAAVTRSRCDDMPMSELFDAARRRLAFQPVYYLHRNRE